MDRSEDPARREKQKELFLRQRETLLLFLERNAISQAQFEKSFGDLCRKMGFPEEYDRKEPQK